MTRRRLIASLTAAIALLTAVLLGAASVRSGRASASAPPRARAALEQQCPDHFSGHRDPANPLDLPVPPGPNPLTGARFYVPGPAKGAAAAAIARMLRINPKSLPDSESWVSFRRRIQHRLGNRQ